MRKRNLILPLFLGSFFITSNVDSAVFNLNETKSNNDFLIAGGDCGGGGGGGSGMSPAERKKRKERQQKNKDAAKKRIIKSKLAAGKPLTDKEKKFAANQIINILKDLKNSMKNGNEALMQAQLKELLVDYGLGAMTDIGIADGTDDNYLKLIEMGDEGIDILIKNFESMPILSEAKSKIKAGLPLTDEENNIYFDNLRNEDSEDEEFYEYFKNNNLNTLDKALNEIKKLIKAVENKDELLIAKIRANIVMRGAETTEDGDFTAETFMDIVYSRNGLKVDNLLSSNEEGKYLIQNFLNGLK